MAQKKPAYVQHTSTLDSVLSDAYGMIDELKDEIESWYDNLPEAFQQGDKGSALQECVDALSNCYEPTVDELIAEITVEYSTSTKKRMSRADRRSEATGMMQCAIDAMTERKDELEALKYDTEGRLLNDDDTLAKAAADEDGGLSDRDVKGNPIEEDVRDRMVSELESLIDEVDSHMGEAEGAEFPGMYG